MNVAVNIVISCDYVVNKHRLICYAVNKHLLCKSMHWFLYDEDLRHERVKKKVVYCSVRRFIIRSVNSR